MAERDEKGPAKVMRIATGEDEEVLAAFKSAAPAPESSGEKARAAKLSKKRGSYRPRNSN